jgi:arylsulfate sulfotransferase
MNAASPKPDLSPFDPVGSDSSSAVSAASETDSAARTGTGTKKTKTRRRHLLSTGIAVVICAAFGIAVPVTAVVEPTAAQLSSRQTWLPSQTERIYTSEYQTAAQNRVTQQKASKHWTLTDPLVIRNAFGTNTMGVYVYFTTDVPTKISYHVHARNGNYPDFSAKAYQGAQTYSTTHEIQVIGLVPDNVNQITLVSTTRSGEQTSSTITSRTHDTLAGTETRVRLTKKNTDYRLSNGLYAILGNDSTDGEQAYLFLYDNSGVLRAETPLLNYRAHRLLFRGGLMYFSAGVHNLVGLDYLGRMVKNYQLPTRFLLHHDYAMSKTGTPILLGTDNESDSVQDKLLVLDKDSGDITRVVDLKKMFKSYEASAIASNLYQSADSASELLAKNKSKVTAARKTLATTDSSATANAATNFANGKKAEDMPIDNDSGFKTSTSTDKTDADLDYNSTKDAASADGGNGVQKDWLHLNTISYDDASDTAILSSRETSTVIKIDHALSGSPRIVWMFGTPSFWRGTAYEKYQLRQVDANGSTLDDAHALTHGGQHSVTVEENGDPNDGIYYLYMFDNNYGLTNTRPDYDWKKACPTINAGKDETDEPSYYKRYLVNEKDHTVREVERIAVPYSSIVSSAQNLLDGTRLVDSGRQGTWGVYDRHGRLVTQYTMKLRKNLIFRVYKYTFDGYLFDASHDGPRPHKPGSDAGSSRSDSSPDITGENVTGTNGAETQ